MKYKGFSDRKIKKLILIFFAAFFDYFYFFISLLFDSSITNISPTIGMRLSCLGTISASFICAYALKFKIGKHHKISLIFLFISFILIIILEIIFKEDNYNLGRFIFAHFLICFQFIFITFTYSIERYLSIYEFVNPFFILFWEGIIEFLISILFSIKGNPFKPLIAQYDKKSITEFALFIFSAIVYLLCSAVLNVY